MQTNAEHAENGGQCPKCGGGNIEGRFIEIEGNEATQIVDCLDCEFSWQDIYLLQRFEPIES